MVNHQKSWLKKILKDSWVVNGAIGATSRAPTQRCPPLILFFPRFRVKEPPRNVDDFPEKHWVFPRNVDDFPGKPWVFLIYIPYIGFSSCKRLPWGKSYARKPLLPTRDNSYSCHSFSWVNPVFLVSFMFNLTSMSHQQKNTCHPGNA